MARPSRIDAALAAHIDELAAEGHTRLGLTKALAARGIAISRRTVGRYLDDHPPERRVAPALSVDDDPAPDWRPPTTGAGIETAADHALETDDLALIVRAAEVARRLEASWGKRAEYDDRAARTWATVSMQHERLRARLVELRPRKDAEADRLTELGEPARAALLKRLRERAIVDARLSAKVERYRATLERLGKM